MDVSNLCELAVSVFGSLRTTEKKSIFVCVGLKSHSRNKSLGRLIRSG